MDQEHEAQFTAFVAARWPRLVGMASLLARDRGEAEDLVQTALAKCYRQWPRLAGTGKEEAYVRVAVLNTYLSSVRTRRFREILSFHVPERAAPDPHLETVDRDLLRRALQQLAPRTRAAVVLRHYNDLSEAQTAAAMSCSVGNVKRLTSEGLAQLRKTMSVADTAPATRTDTTRAATRPVPGGTR